MEIKTDDNNDKVFVVMVNALLVCCSDDNLGLVEFWVAGVFKEFWFEFLLELILKVPGFSFTLYLNKKNWFSFLRKKIK
jgi:hypothetical protein